jgi:protein gp37
MVKPVRRVADAPSVRIVGASVLSRNQAALLEAADEGRRVFDQGGGVETRQRDSVRSGGQPLLMAETTGIEWADATWNPWMGCSKVSAGCARCYMFREQRQYGQDPYVVRRSKTKFAEPVKWSDSRLVFTCSWSDWFHEDADPWRDEAWDVIRRTPQHVYLVLTKRPELATDRLPADWGDGYENVWLGVSIENSAFTHRAQVLRDIPARTRFVSAEPLLGSLFDTRGGRREPLDLDDIDWLIVGGESGPACRPMRPEWARDLRDAALEVGTAFFVKQLGGWPDKRGDLKAVLDGELWREMPAGFAAPLKPAAA